MSLKAKRKVVSSIPPMDGGTYMGVCVAVVDLGQQYKQFEKQKQGKYAEECMFIFEIPDERVEVDGEDKPRWLSSRRFTVSLHERAAAIPDADRVARQGTDRCRIGSGR